MRKNVLYCILTFIIGAGIMYLICNFKQYTNVFIIKEPLKIYSNYTVIPYNEPGVIGIIDKNDLERILKLKISNPYEIEKIKK